MKRKVSILLLLALLVSVVPNVFAEDNFNVSHTIINSKDDIKSINVVLPIFDGFNGAEEITEKIFNIALNAIGDANASARYMSKLKEEMIKNGELAHSAVISLDMTYDYLKQGDILSIQLNLYSYSGGAHGTSQIISINSNTSTGEIYEFKELFKENTDYNSFITDFILKEIEKDSEWYFPNYKETIANKDGKYEFYLDGDKLVVSFGLYDIAPYAAGIRNFIIDSEDIKDILKDEVYDSIKDGKERGFVSYNGIDLNSNKELLYKNDTVLLPLRSIAEALGYKLDWNINDGAIIAGGFIKNEVNSYWTTGKEPVSLVPPVVLDGTTYVPLSYFRDILDENISLGTIGNDKTIVRAYSKDSAEDYLYKSVSKFEKYETPVDVVNMYAEAVKMRDGLVQYGLMDDNLREKNYNIFKEMGFVTGTSSPWVDSYEVTELEENLYQIKFTLRTSVPTDLFISVINVEIVEDGQYISISVLVEDI